jgi:hypothetical protein
MEDLFAVALEAEMARFDDSGMDRPDGHLVNFLSLHPVEVGDADDRDLSDLPAPSIVPGPVRGMEPDWLEPRVPGWAHPILFGNFPLEEVDLRAVRGQ